jgi:hypothetical protein
MLSILFVNLAILIAIAPNAYQLIPSKITSTLSTTQTIIQFSAFTNALIATQKFIGNVLMSLMVH